jgi:endonuclease YncB( thermonuclease family)
MNKTQTIHRKVKRVIDGDTFEVFKSVRGTRFIRLASVNVPEKFQEREIQATNLLKKLIEGKTIALIPRGRIYARIIGDNCWRSKR